MLANGGRCEIVVPLVLHGILGVVRERFRASIKLGIGIAGLALIKDIEIAKHFAVHSDRGWVYL